MTGPRVAVVGASTGLGRCLGVGLARRGATVALMARRRELLDTAVDEAGGGAHAVTCDVGDEASVQASVAEAVDVLGGLDAVVYSAGIGRLARIETLDAATWHEVFATNVVGASLVTAAALPHLRASEGTVAYMTSVSASLTSPWPGLASYTVTKAALDKLVEAWRAEHPEIGFTRLIVGECVGGEGDGVSQFTSSWSHELAGELYPTWVERGLLTDKLMDVDPLIDAVDALVRNGSTMNVPVLAVTPRRPL